MHQRFYEDKAGFYKKAVGEEAAKAKVTPVLPNPNIAKTSVNISCLVSPAATDAELTFITQMGVTHVFCWVEPEQCNVPFLTELREKIEAKGLTLWNVGNRQIGKNADIILATEGRDAAIEKFKQWLRDLSAAGIKTTIFTWEPDGVWSTHEETTRGGGPCRGMDGDVLAAQPPSRGVVFEEETLWANMEYFIAQVLPVAEEVDVRLALHPNDPPVPSIAGIPCLMRNAAAYTRVFALAPHSKHLGMEFCCGCWLEGGKEGFGDITTWLPKFIADGRVFIVHLRNVTCPLPRFAETYIDGGYGDMYSILRLLHTSGYGGTVILDHTPAFHESTGTGAATAFAIGFMKASLLAAAKETGGGKVGDVGDVGAGAGAGAGAGDGSDK